MIHINISILLLTIITGCAAISQPTVNDNDIDLPQENRPGNLYAQMGLEYMKAGQPEVALRKLKRGLSIDPNNPQIYAALGRLYEFLGKLQLAKEHYLRSLELEPNNPFFRNAWGSFLCQTGKYDQADIEFRKALANPLYNQPWDAKTNAGVCALRAGKRDMGENYLRQALTTNPNIPLALIKLAQINLETKHYAEAQQYSNRYEQITPPSPASLLLKCKIIMQLKNKAELINCQQQLIQLFPDAPETKTAKELTLP
jgi:type IV pilus assembly protein PilF